MSDVSAQTYQAGDRAVIQSLLAAALAHLDQCEHGTARRCIRQASALMEVAPRNEDQCAIVLTNWQMRKVYGYVEGNLDSALRLEDVAALIQRSPSYFSRGFRLSCGQSFHQYVIGRRLRRARFLMLTTEHALSQIALECGLADQSHMSRLFKRETGETPSAWRRRRRDAMDETLSNGPGALAPSAVE